jgi:hypothetical protein
MTSSVLIILGQGIGVSENVKFIHLGSSLSKMLRAYTAMVEADGGTVNNPGIVDRVYSFLQNQDIETAYAAFLTYYYAVTADGGSVNNTAITQTVINYLES